MDDVQLILPTSIEQQVRQLDKRLHGFISNNFIRYIDQCGNQKATHCNREVAAVYATVAFYREHSGGRLQIYGLTSCSQTHSKDVIPISDFYSRETYELLQPLLSRAADYEQFIQLYQPKQSQDSHTTSYLPYLRDIDEHIETGRVLVGIFKGQNRGKTGTVLCGENRVAYIFNRYSANRALDGDRVAVRLLKEDISSEQLHFIEQVSEDQLFPLADGIYTALDFHAAQRYGIIVSVIERARDTFCGTLKQQFTFQLDECQQLTMNQPHGQPFFTSRFVPFSPQFPDFLVKSSTDLGAFVGHRIQVQLVDWPVDQRNGIATFRRDFGPVGNKDVEVAVIFTERGIRYQDLEQIKPILEELPSKILDDEGQPHRMDLTDALTCSVDPPGCKDIDDALHCRLVNDAIINKIWTQQNTAVRKGLGVLEVDDQAVEDKIKGLMLSRSLYEVGVHIADVTHYVKLNSNIDLEARQRGTSVYLTDRRIDLLPKILTENVCSLVDSGPRYCFSCLFLIDQEANVYKYQFTKSKIINSANLTYKEAYDLIQNQQSVINPKYNSNQKLKEHLGDTITALFNLSKILRSQRYYNGCLILESPEVDFELDADKNPVTVTKHPLIPTMSMIEEFMLLANVYAAKFSYEAFKSCAVLRRHPEPNQEAFNDLRCKLKNYGIELCTESSKTIRDSMEGAGELKGTLQTLMTRCMQLAKYFSSGSVGYKEYYHYGLALDIYTHFTSPIRRYSDQLVHRFIECALRLQPLPSDIARNEAVQAICNNLNTRKEEADRAGRDASKFFGTLFMLLQELKSGAEQCHRYQGQITNILRNKATVMLHDFGVEVQLKISPNSVAADRMSFTGRGGRTYKIFEQTAVDVAFDAQRPWAFQLCVTLPE